MRINNICIW